ncbi:AzlD domain-containing protein [Arthrobacter sp. A5]|uniref:AzlD domain-containing protein n=1 Tax=Arthrobacter sp. A5 TaxID=576926 RepID=UPI003DA870C1
MNLWPWILLSAALAFGTKLLGYLVPAKVLLANPRMSRVAGTLTIGLLAALTVLNTAVGGQHLVTDARLGALLAAAVALRFKAPFLVVVLVGAGAAAGLRLLGWA